MNHWNDWGLRSACWFFLGFTFPPPPMSRSFFVPPSFLGPIFLCLDGRGVGTASNVGNCILASLFVRPASDESERTESNEANCFGISRVFVRTASKVGNSLGGGRTFLLRLGLGGLWELSMSRRMLLVVLSISTSGKILFVRSSSGGFKRRLSRKSSTSLGVRGLPLTRGFGPKKGECFFAEAFDFFLYFSFTLISVFTWKSMAKSAATL